MRSDRRDRIKRRKERASERQGRLSKSSIGQKGGGGGFATGNWGKSRRTTSTKPPPAARARASCPICFLSFLFFGGKKIYFRNVSRQRYRERHEWEGKKRGSETAVPSSASLGVGSFWQLAPKGEDRERGGYKKKGRRRKKEEEALICQKQDDRIAKDGRREEEKTGGQGRGGETRQHKTEQHETRKKESLAVVLDKE